jgi:hypothetical protein
MIDVSTATLVVAGTGFLLGCRHGLDWDHISAITDLTTASKDAPHGHGLRAAPRRLGLALWYCLGHGLVIALLGLGVAAFGIGLPAGVDAAFQYVVGTTLVVLGGFVLYQLGRDRGGYRYTGRVMLLVGAVRRGWRRARRRETPLDGPLDDLDRRGAFLVGLLHGTGAETPTQVVLFASAGASGSPGGATLILLAFVAGLVLSDLGIAAAWLVGVLGARRAPALQIGLGALTGVSSVAVGAVFLSGHETLLPALLGG